MERVKRCEQCIWATASAMVRTGGSVVLDLGFMKVMNRSEFEPATEQELASSVVFNSH